MLVGFRGAASAAAPGDGLTQQGPITRHGAKARPPSLVELVGVGHVAAAAAGAESSR